MQKIYKYINLLRVKHWMKNILIFLPLLFSGKLLDYNSVIKTILGFFCFSFMASAIYIYNDIKDIHSDKLHFIKKERPLASGKISINKAYLLFVIMITISYFINIFLIKSLASYIAISIYLIINILYSLFLKKIPLIDVIILVLGFVIRAYFGAFIIGVNVSKWLYLTIMMFSFFMAFGKRRNEIIKLKSKSREVLKFYNKTFLDKFMYVSLILALIFYSLWCIDNSMSNHISNDYLIYTIPLVFIIFMKYSLNIEGDSYGDPIDILTNDYILILMILLLAIIIIMIIYVF